MRPVPVQLRSTGYDGSLTEGDEVRVTGRWKDGTLHTKRVQNLTTGGSVLVQRMFLPALAALIVLALFVGGAIALFQHGDGVAGEGRESTQQEFQERVDQQQTEFEESRDRAWREFCEDTGRDGDPFPGC
ncbi:hypothetical protein AAH979_41415 [Plantactinospora sp. ZYX-F-223]|uniref:hypothetical protein n=1 Tax=Plantactinospora sp. ZYX-F-223 TaxID=3144103 RepID=UPI0031FDDF0E